jgi:hypothetical protein
VSVLAGPQAVFNWVHASRGLLARQSDSVEHDFNVPGLKRDMQLDFQLEGPQGN